MNNVIRDKLKELPNNPGCYQMKNSEGKIIYVGKAKNLANRVKSYFVGAHNAKTTRLVMDITDFEYIITSTEKEAFILEINLIKKYRPKYNIMLMDDKTYPYILITHEENPRIIYTRDLNKKGRFFGPYPNSSAAKATVDMLNKIYPLRKCNKLPKKECLYYHIKNCLGPCICPVDKDEYTKIISKVTTLLQGNIKDEVKDLKQKMLLASDALDFEKALEYREIIANLEVIGEKQKMETSLENSDIFNFANRDEYVHIQVFHVRDSKVIERNCFTYEVTDETSEEVFVSFIHQFYLVNNNPLPKEIVIPQISCDNFDNSIKNICFIPKQGRKKDLLDLVLVNILKELDSLVLKKQRAYEMTQGAVDKLAKLLQIPDANEIESFDNSNISGVSSVSAMVRYSNGVKNPKEYRKYKVKTIDKADDVNTFVEVLTRRYKRLKDENAKMPSLIIMDGGKGQVNAAIKVLESLELSIPVCGLIKDDNHITSKILYDNKEIDIEKSSSLYKFLFGLQEEVHRYAISFHHNTHAKNSIRSKLDLIKGIGKVKREQILSCLGEVDFKERLEKLHLTKEQKEQVLKIYNLE